VSAPVLGACARCRRAAHGGPCGAPVAPPAPALLAGAARALERVTVAELTRAGRLRPDETAARALAHVDALADHARQLYALTPAQRDAWRGAYLRARASGATSTARALLFDLDKGEVNP